MCRLLGNNVFLLGPKGGTKTESEVHSTPECSVFPGGENVI